jgi:hypothetical protein
MRRPDCRSWPDSEAAATGQRVCLSKSPDSCRNYSLRRFTRNGFDADSCRNYSLRRFTRNGFDWSDRYPHISETGGPGRGIGDDRRGGGVVRRRGPCDIFDKLHSRAL